jgi:oxysterol-binding protein 1
LWCYYGEVDAQNKFMGKSFEIRPTGVAHVELLLPESGREGREEREHFSWKKVTTNVSGFILGSPTIDHYGDMVVRNHRTGERCVLTFKPRGWRGKDAFEITGQVVDARGRVAYDIAGRWNSQLVARPRTDPGDSRVFSAADRSDGEPEPEFILLWRNSDKPAGTPFNLTPFAITLNDCPAATLRPYIAPTDCRLRPDQRAFEVGQYELANTLKGQQEEKQRAVRRAREEGRVPAHRPRWFVAGVDADTKERVWKPVRVGGGGMLEYWAERERVFREGGRWKGVEEIFIEEPEGIKGVVM